MCSSPEPQKNHMFQRAVRLVWSSRRQSESCGILRLFSTAFHCCSVHSEMLLFQSLHFSFLLFGVSAWWGKKAACLKLYEAFHCYANNIAPFSEFRVMNSQSGSPCLKLAWNEIALLKNFREVWNISVPALRTLKASISTCAASPCLFLYSSAFYIIKRILFVYAEWLVFQFHGWSDNHLCLFYSMMADNISIHLHIHVHASIL